jgi:hypothetical protein
VTCSNKKSPVSQAFYHFLSLGVFRLYASMQRFESARRLQFLLNLITIPISFLKLKQNVVVSCVEINVSLQLLEPRRFPLAESYCERIRIFLAGWLRCAQSSAFVCQDWSPRPLKARRTQSKGMIVSGLPSPFHSQLCTADLPNKRSNSPVASRRRASS